MVSASPDEEVQELPSHVEALLDQFEKTAGVVTLGPEEWLLLAEAQRMDLVPFLRRITLRRVGDLKVLECLSDGTKHKVSEDLRERSEYADLLGIQAFFHIVPHRSDRPLPDEEGKPRGAYYYWLIERSGQISILTVQFELETRGGLQYQKAVHLERRVASCAEAVSTLHLNPQQVFSAILEDYAVWLHQREQLYQEAKRVNLSAIARADRAMRFNRVAPKEAEVVE